MTWGGSFKIARIIPDEVRIKQNNQRLEVRIARIANGMCRDCGYVVPLDNKVVCFDCDIKRKKCGKATKIKKVSAGLCLHCSEPHDRGM